ncbi:MAG: rhomboid family intramembrane serine protease [Acidobacteriota bacterium]
MPYYRRSYGAEFGIGGRITPGIKYLIIANVCIFGLQLLTYHFGGGDIRGIFGLRPADVFHHKWIWQLGTYMFLHSPAGLFHILLNMLMLWMFGTELERLWGTRPFVKYFFICGIGAGLTTLFLAPPNVTTVGASGGVFGVMLAYALMFPNRQILIWFIFPMRAISFVILCIGIELFSMLGMQDGIAHFAHLGGMLFGYLYLKRVWRLREFWNELRWRLRRRRFRVMSEDDERYRFH